MHWDRGYYSQSTYTCGTYRELSPIWLDFAAMVKGHTPPRPTEGSPFSYLELGSGMGFGLCLMAANYPEGSFVGVDFHPEHISHSQWLADQLGLNNIRFLEGDFVALQQDASPLGLTPGHNGLYHYVCAHGIATWIAEPVQAALLALAAAALIPGGLFYCSYNTHPGWLARSAFQKLYSLELGRSDPSQPMATIHKTVASLRRLIGSAESPTPIGRSFPSLDAELDWISQDNPDYLCGEFGCQGWAPLYVADMHQRCSQHKLRHLGSATLPELFDELLAPSLKEAVFEEANPLIRQTLIDLATNKAFRRDLFVKGALPLTRLQAEERLAALAVQGQETTPPGPGGQKAEEPYLFTTTFGQVVGDPKIYGPIDAALREGRRTLAELVAISGQAPEGVLPIVAMLLHDGRIGLDRGAVGVAAAEEAQRVNVILFRLIEQGKPYGSLLLPQLGTVSAISPVEVLIHRAVVEGLEGPMLSTCVLMGLEQMGVQLLEADKTVVADPDAQIGTIERIASDFIGLRLPVLQRLGALPKSLAPQATAVIASAPT
jgi:SAM-dependent methyltransferase